MKQDKPKTRITKKQKPTAKSDNFLPRLPFWIGTARGFLEYFGELAPKEQAKLGFPLQDSDWKALYRLSVSHCLVTQEWGEQFSELYERRRAQADTFYQHARQAHRAANALRYTIAEIETWQQARFPGARPFPTTSPQVIGRLDSVASELQSLELSRDELRVKRKPRLDDTGNYVIYIMVALLKSKGVSDPEARKEVTNFINAARYSMDPEDEGFWSVKSSITNFRRRNPDLAKQIDTEPSKYVQLATGMFVGH
jgi:hypothetical protein